MLPIAYGGAAALYLAASIRYVRSFVRAWPDGARIGSVLLAVGVGLHVLGVTIYTARYGELPLVGLGPSLATLSLIIALVLLALDTFTAAHAVGLLLAPVAFLVLLAGLLARIEPAGSVTAFRGTWFALHVSLSFLGYALWVLSAAAGMMYLMQFSELKHKRLGSVFRFFPSLETLDRVGRRALNAGFVSLTLGIVLGLAWSVRFEPATLMGNPKVIWAVVSWLLMLVALMMNVGERGNSRRAALFSLAGLGAVFVGYLAVRLLLPDTRLFL